MRNTAHPERQTAFTKVVEKDGRLHALIKKASPWRNGVIERSNRTDNEACFSWRRSVISRHCMVSAILYQLKDGCEWRDWLTDFPKWQTVYSQLRRWQLDGTWQKVLAGWCTGSAKA